MSPARRAVLAEASVSQRDAPIVVGLSPLSLWVTASAVTEEKAIEEAAASRRYLRRALAVLFLHLKFEIFKFQIAVVSHLFVGRRAIKQERTSTE